MAQPESVVVAAIVRALEARGCIAVKMHGSQYMPKGFPDLLVVKPGGAMVLLEVKVPGRTDGPAGNGLAAVQLAWLWRLAVQGASCGHADDVPGALLVVFGSERA